MLQTITGKGLLLLRETELDTERVTLHVSARCLVDARSEGAWAPILLAQRLFFILGFIVITVSFKTDGEVSVPQSLSFDEAFMLSLCDYCCVPGIFNIISDFHPAAVTVASVDGNSDGLKQLLLMV